MILGKLWHFNLPVWICQDLGGLQFALKRRLATEQSPTALAILAAKTSEVYSDCSYYPTLDKWRTCAILLLSGDHTLSYLCP
jgi:hypothetical protein